MTLPRPLLGIMFVLTAACTSTRPTSPNPGAPTSAPGPSRESVAAKVPLEPAAPEVSPAAPRSGPACPQVLAFDAHLADLAVPERDIATARRIMRAPTPDVARSPDEQRAAMLKAKLRDPLPALAHLLSDLDLGDATAFTMFEIDEARAAPLIFASMPKSDRNVQYHSFKHFLLRVNDADAPCWNAIVRDAAVRTLEAETNADAAEVALLALGIAGTRSDIDLLRRYLDHPTSASLPEIWQHTLTDAARAALARLGDRAAIEALRGQLDVPVEQRDRVGAVRLLAAIDGAGFSRQRTLAQLLCRQLASPGVPPDGHMLSAQPAERAASALAQIAEGARPDDPGDVEHWKQRCRDRAL